VLAARSNAGDLESKLPLFEAVAKSYIADDLAFAFVTEPIAYSQFSQFPLTSFVFVPPSLRAVTFSGDFSEGNLRTFIDRHGAGIFGTTLPAHNFSMLHFAANVSEPPPPWERRDSKGCYRSCWSTALAQGLSSIGSVGKEMNAMHCLMLMVTEW
jgi:hypothetical protein